MVLADLFMYVFTYLFIYHCKFYLLYIQRKLVLDFVALKMLQGWFESSRVIWGLCVVGVSYCLRTFFELLAPHGDHIDVVSI